MRVLPGLVLMGLSVALGACEEQVAEETALPPVVKLETVGVRATGQVRSISGVVEASDSSELSFQVGGRVLEVNVSEGEAIVPGQVLAVLDQTNYRIAVDSARSRLSNARAQLAEAREELNRKLALIDKEFVTQAAVDSAQAAYDGAKATVSVAESDLERASKDLERTVLAAPYGGTISSRTIDPFVEVIAGRAVFEIQSDGALDVGVLVPETLIREVDYGQAVSVTFPTNDNVAVGGTVSEIASRAGTGNAFGIKVTLAETADIDIRPGMTARVTFNFHSYLNEREAFLIPLSAVSIKEAGLRDRGQSGDPTRAPIFIYDPEKQAVFGRDVEFGGLRGNSVEVFSGLSEGEQVVTAGVAFLYDGMPARPWRPER